jgi:hypothetical protein
MTISVENIAPFIHTEQIQKFLDHPCFLPQQVPPVNLPDPFATYTDLLDNVYLWNSQEKGGVRTFIHDCLKTVSVNAHDIDALTYWQQEKLLSVLTLLAHCYRWNYLPPAPEEFLKQEMEFPNQLWKPLVYIADRLQHPLCGTLWSTKLMNFKAEGQQPGTELQVDKIQFNHLSLTHNWVCREHQEQLEHWIKIFIMTEVEGAAACKACMDILTCVERNDPEKLGGSLKVLHEGILKITAVFNREVRGQKLCMNLWRQHIQPSFVWGLKDAGRPDLLEGVSGLQIGCLQLIDLVLGLDMESVMGKAMLTSRKYFPKHSRDLFNDLEPYRYNLRNFLKNKRDKNLTAQYNQCIEALESYRVSHRQRGKAYIKGDGSARSITTTGLSVKSSYEAASHFEADMNERIQETLKGKIGI